MTPAEVVIDAFGGIRSTARAINVDPSTVLRWCKRADGTLKAGWIPHAYIRPLIDAAARENKRLTIEDVVWGRPDINRRTIKFAPTERTTALGRMAQDLTR